MAAASAAKVPDLSEADYRKLVSKALTKVFCTCLSPPKLPFISRLPPVERGHVRRNGFGVTLDYNHGCRQIPTDKEL